MSKLLEWFLLFFRTIVRPHLVQADELHSFVGCHEKHEKRLRFDAPKEWGSIWTWLALDSESKLIISHYIGQRDADSAWYFMRDLRDWYGATSRVTGTIPSVRCGRPEPRFVSTSHVERLNLSVRTHLRRLRPQNERAQPQTGESQGSVWCALGCVV
jgi:IS1 family transposase